MYDDCEVWARFYAYRSHIEMRKRAVTTDDEIQSQRNHWLTGTQIMAVLIHRLSGGKPVRITREDVEAINGGTTHPVIFTLQEGGEVLEVHNRLPGELFEVPPGDLSN